MPLTPSDYERVRNRLIELGYEDEIAWAQSGRFAPATPKDFALETIYILANSGMKQQVARRIYEKVREALLRGESAATVFGHAGKAGAMDQVWTNRASLHAEYLAVPDREKVDWLGRLPWIGQITKWHLAKNFGVLCIKPDRHIVRLGAACAMTPLGLCEWLAEFGELNCAHVLGPSVKSPKPRWRRKRLHRQPPRTPAVWPTLRRTPFTNDLSHRRKAVCLWGKT